MLIFNGLNENTTLYFSQINYCKYLTNILAETSSISAFNTLTTTAFVAGSLLQLFGANHTHLGELFSRRQREKCSIERSLNREVQNRSELVCLICSSRATMRQKKIQFMSVFSHKLITKVSTFRR